MIQSTNSHIRRLLNEKCQYEDELREAKEKYQKQMTKTIEQCECNMNSVNQLLLSSKRNIFHDKFLQNRCIIVNLVSFGN